MNIVIFSVMFSEVVFNLYFVSLTLSEPVYESGNANTVGLIFDTYIFANGAYIKF